MALTRERPGAMRHPVIIERTTQTQSAQSGAVTDSWIPITKGTQVTSNTARLGASGAGTITTAGSYSDWDTEGYVLIRTVAGVIREIARYIKDTTNPNTEIDVAAADRGLFGTTAGAGAADDTLDQVNHWRAAIEPMRGQERIDAHLINPQITHVVRGRYRSDFQSDERIKGITGRVFNLDSPPLNVEERGRYLEFMAIEEV